MLEDLIECAAAVEQASPASAPPASVYECLRRLTGVTVGLPFVDRKLLDGGGDRTYVWNEDDRITAIGPGTTAIEDACHPVLVFAPAWLTTWRELTAPGQNPWRLPGDDDLDRLVGAALDRTASCAPRTHGGGHGRLRARFKDALADWGKTERRRLGALLGAPAAGEVRLLEDGTSRQMLIELWRRPALVGPSAVVSLLIAELAWGPLVEVSPLPAGVVLHVMGIGRVTGKLLHVRAMWLAGQPASLRPIALPGGPRGATAVEGGDVLVTLFET